MKKGQNRAKKQTGWSEKQFSRSQYSGTALSQHYRAHSASPSIKTSPSYWKYHTYPLHFNPCCSKKGYYHTGYAVSQHGTCVDTLDNAQYRYTTNGTIRKIFLDTHKKTMLTRSLIYCPQNFISNLKFGCKSYMAKMLNTEESSQLLRASLSWERADPGCSWCVQ